MFHVKSKLRRPKGCPKNFIPMPGPRTVIWVDPESLKARMEHKLTWHPPKDNPTPK